ncbi:DUF5696 domain-containing protein [Chitinophaga sp. RCC_12]|uniref:DUF5696 domain-containing protein n=1 Tax=Chitinophaga sp. RCC_12 TaxID=3239226 RepID=UPI0035259600
MGKRVIAFLGILLAISNSSSAQLFEQDFNASSMVSYYVNASMPDRGQFNIAEGATPPNGLITINGGKLELTRVASGGRPFFVRNTNFAAHSGFISVAFKMKVTTPNTFTTAAQLLFGSGLTADNIIDASPAVYMRIGINYLPSGFSIRNTNQGIDGPHAYAGEQTIRMYLNNSGAAQTYIDPNGAIETIANDKWDMWIGNTREFNDAGVTTPLQDINNFKLVLNGSPGTVTVDNLLITDMQNRTCTPVLPLMPYSNSVSFDFTQKRFLFNYFGTDSVTYEYKPGTVGTLAALKCIVGDYSFNPSSSGGIGIDSASRELQPWSPGISYSLKSLSATADTLTARWKMTAGGTDSVLYTYKFYISGRTLVLAVSPETANVPTFSLDRSANTIDPVVVPVPYLTLFNVLYTNNTFTTMYMDWEKSTASEIAPSNRIQSSTSVVYAQSAKYKKQTNGKRNLVRETVYLTTSPRIEDVFPSIPNPVSPMIDVSADRLVLDIWRDTFAVATTNIKKLHDAGITKLWVLKHVWQNGGYDNMYPDVMPANAALGGNAELKRLSDSAAAYNYLFGLHENYVDIYPNAPSWNTSLVALDTDGTLRKAWFNNTTGVQSYLLKPSQAGSVLNNFAPVIHSTFSSTSSFLDVHLGTNPSTKVDYDSSVSNAGTYIQTLKEYRALIPLLRAHHTGPVSVEGTNHFMNAGYMDDVEAQINSGTTAGYWQGVRMPLLVDFQLQKVHPLLCGHGVGYYERFFSNDAGTSQYKVYPLDSTLTYMATEIAFGNAGFIPNSKYLADLVKVAKLEYKHVYAAQKLYARAKVVSVLYHDNGAYVDASTYIRNHPASFSNRSDSNFMGQVKVVYDNGTIVCVNRNPYKKWKVTLGSAGGWYNYHAIINNIDSLDTGASDSTTYQLPVRNGWVVYSPQQPALRMRAEDPAPVKEKEKSSRIKVYPVPSQGLVYVDTPGSGVVQITATDMTGKAVYSSSFREANRHSVSFSRPGLYVLRVLSTTGKPLYTGKVVIVGW